MLPDRKTVLFMLALAAAITVGAHLILTSAKENKQREAHALASKLLQARSEAVAPALRKAFAENPKLLAELSKMGAGASDSRNEFAFLHPRTSDIVVFRIPRNVTDPGRVASSIAALPSPLLTAYDPTNGVDSPGMIMNLVRMEAAK